MVQKNPLENWISTTVPSTGELIPDFWLPSTGMLHQDPTVRPQLCQCFSCHWFLFWVAKGCVQQNSWDFLRIEAIATFGLKHVVFSMKVYKPIPLVLIFLNRRRKQPARVCVSDALDLDPQNRFQNRMPFWTSCWKIFFKTAVTSTYCTYSIYFCNHSDKHMYYSVCGCYMYTGKNECLWSNWIFFHINCLAGIPERSTACPYARTLGVLGFVNHALENDPPNAAVGDDSSELPLRFRTRSYHCWRSKATWRTPKSRFRESSRNHLGLVEFLILNGRPGRYPIIYGSYMYLGVS